MPRDDAEFIGRKATVTGWGRLKYGGGVPSKLQQVEVPIIENNVCQEMFNTAGHNKKILPSFLCAGYATGQKDSCEVIGNVLNLFNFFYMYVLLIVTFDKSYSNIERLIYN